MTSPELIESLLIEYNSLAVFIGSFFFGESIIITAAYLASHYEWSFWRLFAAAFAGTVIADIVWYIVGRYLQRTRLYTRIQSKEGSKTAILGEIIGKRPFIALLFVKFLYGSRTIMILYLAARKVRLSLFILFDSLGTIIWLAVILPIGYAAAHGITTAGNVFDVLQIAVGVLVVSALLFRIVSIWLSKRLSTQK